MSLVLVLALLGALIAREIDAYRKSRDTVAAVSLALAVQDLVHETQRERGLTNGLLGGDGRLRQPVDDQRGAVDRALRDLQQAMASNPPGAERVRSAARPLTDLDATRSRIDELRTSRQAAFQYYTDAIDALNHLSLGLDQASDPTVRHGLQALYALGEAKEQTARERGFLNGVFAADAFGPGEYVQFLDIRAAKLAGLAAFARDATAAQRSRLDAALDSANAVAAAESENIAIASSAGPLVRPVDPITWWTRMTAVIDEQRTVQQAVGSDVRQRADVLRRNAAVILGAFALAAMGSIAVQVALVVAAVRAIVRPLATLATDADDVSSRRLPDVIAAWRTGADTRPDPPARVRTPPGAGAEIAAVAGALDRVQSTAFDLASEQALVRRNTTESMVSLARRSQNLVRRQLNLISEFEREELDPKALSNLFELDHLATRMRRNAESLLVLVGEGSPRRWAEPIPLSDVIRAGLSEVDDYRRVVLRRMDDVLITGAAASELAHILAELIENGLAFSPPDLEVEIYGRGGPGGYLLAVVDHGVGMPAEQLARANARLCGEQDFVVAPTRNLGHYVVGRLAQRLGIGVELSVSPVSGIVARLTLPPGMLEIEPDQQRDVAAERAAASGAETGWGDSGRVAGSPAIGAARGDTAALPVVSAPAVPGRPAIAVDQIGAQPASPTSAPNPPARSRGGAGPSAYTQFVSPRMESAAAPVDSAHESSRETAKSGSGHTPIASPQTESAPVGRPRESFRAPAPSVSGEPAVQRTKNGLVKRNKKARAAATRPGSDAVPRLELAPAVDRSPEEIRSMLSAFRTGHQRGVPAPAAPRDNDISAVASAYEFQPAVPIAEEIR
ncbi:nitrate- and nitrite sensing domain-containing protein [Nocardia sp. NBC_00508]|uniref:sensor histidine kinase n=1 Tax=Nocardia sp. NBC_00508 TaxID=2975992 RepID=UPI002E804C0D|nr:nitrate- and nitrite sensing domain-containing protein [Nocardia sp. NBC_00508]WUD67443.1 nitrate- and nitrite sensing domain-containing protein [Nocardia sp. NBC_00508]